MELTNCSVGFFEGLQHDPAGYGATLADFYNEAGVYQYPDVLGDRGEAHRERFCQIGDCCRRLREATEDRTPGPVGERLEYSVDYRLLGHVFILRDLHLLAQVFTA